MVKPKLLINRYLKILNLRFASSSTLFITSIVVLVICSIEQLGKLEFLELAVFDLMMRSRAKTELDSRIVVVGINESDIQRWQQSTFTDNLLAKLLAKLQQHNPKVIGLDIYRDLPQPPGNAKLLKQLEAENIIVIDNIDRDGGVPAPPNIPRYRVGFNNFLLDPDGKVRRNFMAFHQGNRLIYSFALQMSLVYLDARDRIEIKPEYLKLKQTIFPRLKADSGGYQRSPSDVFGVQTILNYRSPGKAARQLTFSQVLNNDFNPDSIAGKVVIVGYTAPSKKDIFSTPFDVEKMPGVTIHAQMVSQIISTVLNERALFVFLPQWGEVVWILFWSLTGAVLVWRIKHPIILGVSFIATVGALSGVCFISFLGMMWIPATPAIISLLMTTGVISAYKTFYSSSIDELTGLANRQQIIELLQRSLAKHKDSSIAVLSINIPRFKTVSDSLGNSIGDILLILAVKRMQNCIRHRDELARVGIRYI